jgi:hypothetical protein
MPMPLLADARCRFRPPIFAFAAYFRHRHAADGCRLRLFAAADAATPLTRDASCCRSPPPPLPLFRWLLRRWRDIEDAAYCLCRGRHTPCLPRAAMPP